MALVNGGVDHAQARRFGKIVLVENFFGCCQSYRLRFRVRHSGTALDFAEIFFHQLFYLTFIDITGNYQGSIVGSIPAFVKIAHIFQRGILQVLQFADGCPVVRMVGGVEVFYHGIIVVAIGAVVHALAFFVLNDFLLVFKSCLSDSRQ